MGDPIFAGNLDWGSAGNLDGGGGGCRSAGNLVDCRGSHICNKPRWRGSHICRKSKWGGGGGGHPIPTGSQMSDPMSAGNLHGGDPISAGNLDGGGGG